MKMPNAAPHLWAGRDDEARQRDQSLFTCRDARPMDVMCIVVATAGAIYCSSRVAVNLLARLLRPHASTSPLPRLPPRPAGGEGQAHRLAAEAARD